MTDSASGSHRLLRTLPIAVGASIALGAGLAAPASANAQGLDETGDQTSSDQDNQATVGQDAPTVTAPDTSPVPPMPASPDVPTMDSDLADTSSVSQFVPDVSQFMPDLSQLMSGMTDDEIRPDDSQIPPGVDGHQASDAHVQMLTERDQALSQLDGYEPGDAGTGVTTDDLDADITSFTDDLDDSITAFTDGLQTDIQAHVQQQVGTALKLSGDGVSQAFAQNDWDGDDVQRTVQRIVNPDGSTTWKHHVQDTTPHDGSSLDASYTVTQNNQTERHS